MSSHPDTREAELDAREKALALAERAFEQRNSKAVRKMRDTFKREQTELAQRLRRGRQLVLDQAETLLKMTLFAGHQGVTLTLTDDEKRLADVWWDPASAIEAVSFAE